LSTAVKKARVTGEVDSLDLELIRPDGSKRWITICGEAVRDASGLVVQLRGTVQDITERKRAELALRESEERFRVVANAAPVMIWKAGPDKLCKYFNQPWLEFTGRPLDAELGNGWAESVHPDDLRECLETYNNSFDRRVPFRMEYRLRRHDGEYRWVEDTGVPIVGSDGSFAGYIGSCVDITDRKRGEEALRTVSGKLIEAQERERSRIARELHDDINQRLAMVAIELQQLRDIPLLSVVKLREQTGELFKQITEISSDIQLLSHRLHSSSLEYLGLVPAMKGFCEEFAKHQNVEVDFADSNVPSHLPPDTALGLFRILQEALHNALKHSGVRRFEVRLKSVPRGLRLTVRDSGKGFDADLAITGRGLGLVSMQERVSLLKGTISIASKPNLGTEIKVDIPLAGEMDATLNLSA
jgi:PAS domain S-box-containing protein